MDSTAEARSTGSSHPANFRLALAVLTYRRNDELRALLPQLVAQCEALATVTSLANSEILVVDNNPDQRAKPVTDAAGPLVRYVHEKVPGIASARARAVHEANSDAIIFIDDDEIPSSQWLTALWHTWNTYNYPAAVVGRVTPTYFGQRTDKWIDAGEFFVRPRHSTGTLVQTAAANNLLLNMRTLEEGGFNFDCGLGLAGGEDTLLTAQLSNAGHRLVWCHEAEVVAVLPEERMERRWLLRRTFNHGAVQSRVLISLKSSRYLILARFRLFIIGITRVLLGAIEYLIGAAAVNIRFRARGMRLVFRGAGIVAGSVGKNVVEYAREETS